MVPVLYISSLDVGAVFIHVHCIDFAAISEAPEHVGLLICALSIHRFDVQKIKAVPPRPSGRLNSLRAGYSTAQTRGLDSGVWTNSPVATARGTSAHQPKLSRYCFFAE